MARVAMYLQVKHAIRESMAYAKYTEQRGFEAVWQANMRASTSSFRVFFLLFLQVFQDTPKFTLKTPPGSNPAQSLVRPARPLWHHLP
jgi:hypothetical protein